MKNAKPPAHPAGTPWLRLVEAARRAPVAPPDTSLPPGLATRVVALAFANGRPFASGGSLLSWLDHRAWRALGVASLAMALCVLWSMAPTAVTAGASNDSLLSDYLDPVGEVLAVVDPS